MILMWRWVTMLIFLLIAWAWIWLLVWLLLRLVQFRWDYGSAHSLFNFVKLEYNSIVIGHPLMYLKSCGVLGELWRLLLRFLSDVFTMVLMKGLFASVLAWMTHCGLTKLWSPPRFIRNMIGSFGFVFIVHLLDTHPAYFIIEHKGRLLYA